METKVLNIGYRDRIDWGLFISDIGDTHAYRAFISDIIYNEILITKSWFSVIDIIYLIKMLLYTKTVKNNVHLYAIVQ